jgi:hypothetical protein
MSHEINHMNLIRDALYNLSINSCSSNDYGKGVLIGLVSALMSIGFTHTECMILIANNWQGQFRKSCIPECWQEQIKKNLRNGMLFV